MAGAVYASTSLIIELSITIITCFLGMFGNFFLLYTIVKKRDQRTQSYIFLSNQAFSDGLHGIALLLEMFLTCTDWFVRSFGLMSCQLSTATKITSYKISGYLVALIALERFLKVYFPLRKGLRPLPILICLWIYIQFSGVILLIGNRTTIYFTESHLLDCAIAFKSWKGLQATFYSKMFAVVVYNFIPFLFPGLLYLLIVIKVLRRKNRNQSAKSQTTKLCFAITLSFYVFNLPVNYLEFALDSKQQSMCRADGEHEIRLRILPILAHLSQTINPIILYFFNESFKKDVNELFSCIFSCFKKSAISAESNQIANAKNDDTESTNMVYVPAHNPAVSFQP